jgi:hypothetical protein
VNERGALWWASLPDPAITSNLRLAGASGA